MVKRLVYRFEAETDLNDVRNYYSKLSDKLTSKFFEDFFLTIRYIEQAPAMFQVRYRGIRIAPLYRFPYGIHYRETANKIIIYRILHTKRYFK